MTQREFIEPVQKTPVQKTPLYRTGSENRIIF